ncbi:MAG TPA: hypothetical protein VIJ94_06410 [Caulobacteraceae bacterium]
MASHWVITNNGATVRKFLFGVLFLKGHGVLVTSKRLELLATAAGFAVVAV